MRLKSLGEGRGGRLFKSSRPWVGDGEGCVWRGQASGRGKRGMSTPVGCPGWQWAPSAKSHSHPARGRSPTTHSTHLTSSRVKLEGIGDRSPEQGLRGGHFTRHPVYIQSGPDSGHVSGPQREAARLVPGPGPAERTDRLWRKCPPGTWAVSTGGETTGLTSPHDLTHSCSISCP